MPGRYFVKMAAIEDAVYLMTLDHDLYLPTTILFSPPNEGQKKKKTGKMSFERGCGFRRLGRKFLGKSNKQSRG